MANINDIFSAKLTKGLLMENKKYTRLHNYLDTSSSSKVKKVASSSTNDFLTSYSPLFIKYSKYMR